MLILVTHVLAFIAGGAGVFLTLLFFAVDEDDQRLLNPESMPGSRDPRPTENKLVFIGDSPPGSETTITYH